MSVGVSSKSAKKIVAKFPTAEDLVRAIEVREKSMGMSVRQKRWAIGEGKDDAITHATSLWMPQLLPCSHNPVDSWPQLLPLTRRRPGTPSRAWRIKCMK